MKIARLVSYLDSLGVKLKADGSKLRCRAPKGVLTDALWQQIGERKEEILTFLRRQATAEAPIQPYPRNNALPLSFSQQRLWFLNQLEGGSATYNEHWAMRLIGPLQSAPLTESINALVRRHEMLRTSFPMRDGEPFQKISPFSQFPYSEGQASAHALIMPLSVVGLQELPQKEQAAEIQRLSTREKEQPFNLEDGPLWRMKLLPLAEDEHVLLLTMHHIISDAWSMAVIMRDLITFYNAFCHGNTHQRATTSLLRGLRPVLTKEGTPRDMLLPPLAIQYADFALWQRERSEDWERQLSYWREQLAGAPPLLALPTDHPRPAVQSFRGSSQTFSLPQEVVAPLQQMRAKLGMTLFMTWLAAFKVLLYRYSGTSNLLVGTPITNRVRSEIEPLIGFFANTVVLRTELSGELSLLELLGRVRQVALDAYKHQEVPFEKVVEALQPERTLSYNPLFNVMFVLQNTPRQSIPQSGLTMTLLEMEHLTARFDLTLFIEAGQGEAFQGRWEYSTDLFEHETITRMSGHFQTLLAALVANPEKPIGAIPLLTEAERHQLLVEWNQTQTNYPSDKCIHTLFEQQAERTPEACAVVPSFLGTSFGDQKLTYRELNARANQLAHYLIKRGISRGALVGLCVERSLEMVVALLAILKAGGTYVPLEPNYPLERLAFMLEDTQISLLLTQKKWKLKLPSTTESVYLDTAWNVISQESQENPTNLVRADNLAYIMYTSGSTGRPKGVSVPHRAVVRLVKETNYISLSAEQVFLQLAPISFDASTLEIWGPLLNGGRLVVMSPGKPSLRELGEAIRAHQITTLWLTAGLFHLMVDEQLENLESLRQLLAGGDVLSVAHVQKALQGLEHCQLINGYGPTENTTFTCCYPISDPERIFPSVPIGRPIANTQVYILDPYLEPVPIGVAGELYVGGDGLAQGYYNRPQLTREKFIPNPFGPARLYKTGDLCRYLPDGNIQFLGRIDHQVKIRGFRIELGEIEAVLNGHESVQKAVVVAREEEGRDKRLVAYVVCEPPALASSTVLRSWLTEKLPDYMLPAAFVQLESLPLNPNGKVDRRALPAPDSTHLASSTDFIAPRSETEEVLAEIWQELLKVEQVGVHDNFFELGGHSLLATQVISRIREIFEVEVPLRYLFERPALESLAIDIEELIIEELEALSEEEASQI